MADHTNETTDAESEMNGLGVPPSPDIVMADAGGPTDTAAAPATTPSAPQTTQQQIALPPPTQPAQPAATTASVAPAHPAPVAASLSRHSPHPTPQAPTQPMPHGSPTRIYLNQNVTPYLLEAMKHLATTEPEKPLKWLSEFLAAKSAKIEGS